MQKHSFFVKRFICRLGVLSGLALFPVWNTIAKEQKPVEIREYEGKKLSPFERNYITSIRGSQNVDIATYRLRIEGMVDTPQSLAYEDVLALPQAKRVIVLHCVEGWEERLLFEGVRLADLFSRAGIQKGATTVIFHAVDGYSSSLDYDFVKQRDLILAAKVNGLTLNPLRGFPFQLVAEDKYGYKWVRWLDKIELTDTPYKGYWESRGYSNEADIPNTLLESDDAFKP